MDKDELIEVLWSITLSDHMGDVLDAINPIIKNLGLVNGSLDDIRTQMISYKLLPDYAKDDYK